MTMDNGNESAFPGQELDGSGMPRTGLQWGLTKREYFAGLAMQGLVSDGAENYAAKDLAAWSVSLSDALLAELAKESK